MRSHFIKLVMIRLKFFAKNLVILFCLLLTLLVSCLYAYSNQKAAEKNRVFNIAIVNNDKDDLSLKLIDKLQSINDFNIQVTTKNKALRQLSLDTIDGVFVLHSNFTEKINDQEFKDIITLYVPVAISSAAPVSEYVSTQVMYMWLEEYFMEKVTEIYNKAETNEEIDLQEILTKLKNLDEYQYIININHNDLSETIITEKENDKNFLFDVTGIFACFIFFAAAYSSEWVFSLKKRALRQRLNMMNISIALVCLASLIACIIICMISYVLLLVVISPISDLSVVQLFANMLIFFVYLTGIGGLAFVITYLSRDSNQFIILTSATGLLHLSLSGLIAPLPEWAKLSKTFSYVLPGTQLARSFLDFNNIFSSLVVSLLWLVLAMAIVVITNKKQLKNN